jgi:seryl-tRNA synthetase
MLDIRYIRENSEYVAEKSKQKGYDVNITKLLELDERRRELLADIEMIRAERNKLADAAKGQAPSVEAVEHGKHLKQHLTDCEDRLRPIEDEFNELLSSVPNVTPEDTPLGGEEDNVEVKKWGNTDPRDFEPEDHLSWAEKRGLVDFERGAKVAGNKFYYLKADLVQLELALLQYALNFAKDKGFWPMSVPHMVNTEILEGAGFSARGKEKQVYKVEDENLNLIATAEIPLTGFFAGEIIPTQWLPSKMVAWSPSYRAEGGAYGKHSRGLFRVHQFNKVEMYVYSKPGESESIHDDLLKLEEEFCQALEIPYRVVRIAAGDLGAPAYKKFDVEYWSAVDKSYRELMSCSNVTDYQARRLNIRYKDNDGQTQFVHTLNATLAATSRLMIAIIENNQTKDGKVKVPQVLQKYLNGQTEL